MVEEISDHRLQHFYQKKIAENPEDKKLLTSQLYCGSRVLKSLGHLPAVFVFANKEQARFWGMTTCKNAWSCPVCSAKQMSKYAADIAAAIDAINQPNHNQAAIMITFTIPHTRNMTCAETTEILFNTWKDLIQRGNKNVQCSYYLRTTGERKYSGTKGNNPFASFCETFNCKHRVRVGEFTWGEHGWHPHFHCLFWVDKNKIQETIKWQEILQERWYHLAKKNTLKTWNKMFPDNRENNLKRVHIMYQNLDKDSNGVYISTDKNGKVIIQKSSMYICGWGADKELTGNYRAKATHENHMTPHQILEKAYESQGDERDKWLNLYMEFARTVRIKRRNRIKWSCNSGIKQIIQQWKTTQGYREVLKKKAIQQAKNVGEWVPIGWLDEKSWLQICLLNRTTPIKAGLLEICKEGCYELIDDYLAPYNIRFRRIEEHPNIHIKEFLENLISIA